MEGVWEGGLFLVYIQRSLALLASHPPSTSIVKYTNSKRSGHILFQHIVMATFTGM